MDRHLGLVDSLFKHVLRSSVDVVDCWSLPDHDLFPPQEGLWSSAIGGEWAPFSLYFGFKCHTIVFSTC